jgi:hypothetical protein
MEIHRILNPTEPASHPSYTHSRAHSYSHARTPSRSPAPTPADLGALHQWWTALQAYLSALGQHTHALLLSALLTPAQHEHAARLLHTLQLRPPLPLAPAAVDAHLAAVLDAGNALFRQGGFLRMPEEIRERYTALASRFAEGAQLRAALPERVNRCPGALERYGWP